MEKEEKETKEYYFNNFKKFLENFGIIAPSFLDSDCSYKTLEIFINKANQNGYKDEIDIQYIKNYFHKFFYFQLYEFLGKIDCKPYFERLIEEKIYTIYQMDKIKDIAKENENDPIYEVFMRSRYGSFFEFLREIKMESYFMNFTKKGIFSKDLITTKNISSVVFDRDHLKAFSFLFKKTPKQTKQSQSEEINAKVYTNGLYNVTTPPSHTNLSGLKIEKTTISSHPFFFHAVETYYSKPSQLAILCAEEIMKIETRSYNTVPLLKEHESYFSLEATKILNKYFNTNRYLPDNNNNEISNNDNNSNNNKKSNNNDNDNDTNNKNKKSNNNNNNNEISNNKEIINFKNLSQGMKTMSIEDPKKKILYDFAHQSPFKIEEISSHSSTSKSISKSNSGSTYTKERQSKKSSGKKDVKSGGSVTEVEDNRKTCRTDITLEINEKSKKPQISSLFEFGFLESLSYDKFNQTLAYSIIISHYTQYPIPPLLCCEFIMFKKQISTVKEIKEKEEGFKFGELCKLKFHVLYAEGESIYPYTISQCDPINKNDSKILLQDCLARVIHCMIDTAPFYLKSIDYFKNWKQVGDNVMYGHFGDGVNIINILHSSCKNNLFSNNNFLSKTFFID
eukprot:TRINITY_DN872_c1_g1_i1.p1 TRINITY_DN872_c1_g1~~TRINITY_DN872_c1_g1_i1.p1  ORF type:complete len:621 (+),score=158.51 TRINITY_DN872_c1_g1_i1:136-1998(+)